jgi:RNA polymerase sigma-70 factor (ECF subfamily)
MPKSLSLNEEKLKRLALKARTDKKVFAQIYKALLEKVYGYFYYRVKQKEIAEDLTQECFLKILKNLKMYEEQEASFSAWVFTIARHTVIDHFRQKKEEISLETERELEEKGSDETERFADRNLLENALRNLKEDYREVLYLRFFADLSLKDTARVMEKTENAVKLLQFRAVKALKKELEKDERREKG